MSLLTKQLVIRALERLGELAQEQGLVLEVCLYGGALMMLAYDARTITKDVDAIVRPSTAGRKLAGQVAREMGLPADWLNDQVRMFVAPSEQLRSLPWEGPGIQLTAPAAGYLLAMKALACRDPLPGYEGDIGDLRFLIGKMNINSVDEIQAHIDKYYPNDVIKPEHRVLLESLVQERGHS